MNDRLSNENGKIDDIVHIILQGDTGFTPKSRSELDYEQIYIHQTT